MASEIEAAEERWRRFFHGEMDALERDEYYHDALSVEDRDALCQWASDRMAADRAGREERARPIDAEWCEKNGAMLGRRPYAYQWAVGAVCVCVWTEDVVSVWVEGRLVAGVTNRGQLLDLLRVLKGGAE